MERFNALGRGAQLMLVGAVLLLIDLFLPWQDYDIGDLGTFSGWRGFAGVVLGLLTIVLLAWLVVRIASVNIPLPVSTAMTAALLGVLILIFAVIKLLTILGDEQTIWAWLGVVLAVVITVGAFQVVQEAGGVETLQTEMSSMTSTTAAAPPPAAPSEPAPPAEAAPPAEPAPPAEAAPAEPPPSEPAGQSDREM